MDEYDKINHLTDIIEACLLPELIQELGADHLESLHFDQFRQFVDAQFIQIFDYVQQNEKILYDVEWSTLKVRCKFLLLLCEQTAPNTLYQCSDPYLLNNLVNLVEKHFRKMLENDPKLVAELFKYYKQRLRTECWKKHLGTLHSFDRFCTLYYGICGNQLNRDLCTFLLSVSLLLEEFFDPTYKEMSFRIMGVILIRTPDDVLKDMNLHNVIYETLFRNIPKINSKQGITTVWNCLYKCIDLFNIRDHSKWNKIDDLLEAIVYRISWELSSDICIELYQNIPKFCSLYISNRDNLIDYITDDNLDNFDMNINFVRDHCKSIDSPVSYRWVKKLLKLFVTESTRLLENAEIVIRLLYVMHVCYLVCIATIPVKVCEPHLIEFFGRFPSVLMKVLSVHKNNKSVTQSVVKFLKTLLDQIQIVPYQTQLCKDLCLYQITLDRLLKHEIFIQIKN